MNNKRTFDGIIPKVVNNMETFSNVIPKVLANLRTVLHVSQKVDNKNDKLLAQHMHGYVTLIDTINVP